MPTNKPEVVLPDWAIAAAFRELDNCQNHSSKECRAYNKVFNRALELHRADTLTRPADGEYVMVPSGWVLERTAANEVRVTCEGDASTIAREDGSYSGSIAEYVLYDLVSDMLSAAPQQPVEDGLARIAGMTFLLHENPDADEDIPPTQLVMAMSVGDTVYCHRITHGNNGICRDDAPQQHGLEVGEVERLREQMEIVWRYLQKISPWHTSNDMLWCDEMMVGIDLLAQQVSQPQQPAQAVAWMASNGDVMSARSRRSCTRPSSLNRYHIPLIRADTPPPAIDIGKLRELVAKWRNLDTDFAAYKFCADELAALIGDGEKVNG